MARRMTARTLLLTHRLRLLRLYQPFNHGYTWLNTSENEVIADPSISFQNTFVGSVTQQATSVVTATDPNCYEGNTGCFSVYGFEYKPGFEDGVSAPVRMVR